MYFIGFMLIAFLTLIITAFAGAQIVGILFIKIPKKEYKTIIGLIFWAGILYLYYLAITSWFNEYFQVYFWCTIIGFIICLLNLGSLRNEDISR